jgi:cytochrome c oxidase cbb3-type subunit 1
LYIIRALGGVLFLVGALIMAYNLWRTASGRAPTHERAADVPALPSTAVAAE